MYEAHYGFREKPFALLPDPAFLYLSHKHAAALSMLEYVLSDQAGFVVITGEVGCGKTTLIRKFLKLVDRGTTVGLISNTHNVFGDLLSWILLAFDIKPVSDDKSALYRTFVDFLVDQYAKGRRTILVVDEAQNMSLEILEELRLLSNLNADKDLLLQIILVGQPELLEKLRRPELRQFAQRVSVNYHLSPLEYPETRAYIRHRLRIAGGNPGLFTETAAAAVHCLAGGVPRLINSICDMALVYGYAEARRDVDVETVALVAEHKGASGLGVFAEGSAIDREGIRRQAAQLLEQLTPEALNLGPAEDPGGAAELCGPTPADRPSGANTAAQASFARGSETRSAPCISPFTPKGPANDLGSRDSSPASGEQAQIPDDAADPSRIPDSTGRIRRRWMAWLG